MREEIMWKHTAVAVAALALTGCGGSEPAPVVTVTEQAAPTPDASGDMMQDKSARTDILDSVWENTPKKGQRSMCEGFAISPDYMWKSFDSRQRDKYTITKAQFMDYFEDKCA